MRRDARGVGARPSVCLALLSSLLEEGSIIYPKVWLALWFVFPDEGERKKLGFAALAGARRCLDGQTTLRRSSSSVRLYMLTPTSFHSRDVICKL
ncbi:hypothetical protein LX32DRAFT_35825 [Colletotrichum zoysiae]|uniref:Uncharacterized protein n=1 Tax=Colletotrichum zoysiae TaxID=1216348 RepID=A0AAD9HDL4_9PEZI|nr:hypothetical protein LX32DRAFT_35825 [Colletotrichum zoysiae]